MEKEICPNCERGHLELRGGKGRMFPKRGFAEVELPEDVLLPQCSDCHLIILGPEYAAVGDAGIERAYQSRLAALIEESLAKVTAEAITQQELEWVLGLSRGYLSKVKGGKESSRLMAAVLAFLAADPQGRLAELRAAYAGRRDIRRSSPLVPLTQEESDAPPADVPRHLSASGGSFVDWGRR